MKKVLSAVLVLIMLLVLTACGSNHTEPDDPGGSNGSGILDTGDDAKKPDPGPSEPTPGGQETPPVGGEQVDLPTILQVKQGECWLDEWDENYNTLYTISWDQLILAEESAAQFPALSEALAELNAESQENGRIVEENYRPLALEAAENSEFFGGYTYTDAYTIQRADDRIFSIRGMTDEYTGGPHPMTWYYGVNIDSATGAAVTLGDVLTETESLTALLVDTLRETYPHVELEGAEETLAAYAPEDFF